MQVTTNGTTGDKLGLNGVNAGSANLAIGANSTAYVSGAASTFNTVTVLGSGNTEARGALRLENTLNVTNGVSLLGNTTIGSGGGTLNGAISTGVAGTSTLTLGTALQSGTGSFIGVISDGTGTLALAVAAGTQTLASANTYSGGTTINGGRLNAGNATAFGTGSVSVGNNAILGVTATGGVTIANAITLSGAATTINTSAAGNTSNNGVTLSGAITGTSALTLAANGDTSDTGGGSNTATLLSNIGNSFTGTVTITSGVVDMASNLGDASNTIVLNGGGIVNKVGSGNTNFTRNIQVGASGGFLRSFGTTAPTNTYSGIISNVTGVSYATLRLTDGGTKVLSGDGSGYVGSITNAGATSALQVTAANANWKGTDFATSTNTMTFSGGGTALINSLTKANNDIILNNGTTLDILSGNISAVVTGGSWFKSTAGAAGSLTSSSGTLTIASGALSGAITTGDQQEQLVIKDASGAIPLTLVKTNQNTFVLTAANTYTGGTVINGGALLMTQALPSTGTVLINSGGAFGSTTATDTLLTSGKISTASTGSLLISQNVSAPLDLTSYANLSLSAAPAPSGFSVSGTTITGAITAGSNGYLFGTPGLTSTLTTVGALSGSGVGLTKRGSDTLVIAGTNTYTGATTINGGTVNLDFSNAASPTADILANTGSVTLAGGTLQLTGKANTTNSQTLAGLTLGARTANTITLSANATANPLVLNTGTFTRGAGATVNFTQPTGTVSATNGVRTSAGTGSTILTDATTGGAYATVGTTDWAAKDATNGFVVGLSTIGGYTNFTIGSVALAGNADLTGAAGIYTLTGTSTPTTLRNIAITGNTVALAGFNLATGGILSSQTLTISGTGNVMAGTAGGEIVVNQTANTLTISSVLANNTSASTLTKTGAGTLLLTNATNTISGAINVNAGTLQYNSSPGNGGSYTMAAAGTVTTVSAGATLSLNQTESNGFGAAVSYALGSTIALNGATLNAGGSTGAMFQRFTGGTAYQLSGTNNISQNSGGYGQYLAIEGAMSGTGTLILNRQAAVSNNSTGSTLNLKGDMSGYSGNVIVSGGGESIGAVIFGNSTGWGTGSLTLGGLNSTAIIGDRAATNYSGSWSGGSALSFTTGTLAAAGAITVNAGGNLQVINASGNAVIVQTNGGLTVNGGRISTIGTGGTSAFAPNGTWAFSGASTVSADVKLLNTGTIFNVATSGTTLMSGIVSGSNGFAKTGDGILLLTGANSYAGTTFVNAGTLQAGSTAATNGSVTLNGGNLTVSNGVTYNIDGGLTFASNTNATVAAASGTATLRGFDVNSADIVVNTGVNASINNTVNIATNAYGIRFDVNGTGTLAVGGVIGGTGAAGGAVGSGTMVGTDSTALWKLGTGDLTLTGAGTFTAGANPGATSIQSGRLILSGGNDRLPSNSAVYLGNTSNSSGKLVLDGISQTITGLTTVGTGTSNAVVGGNAALSSLTVNNTNNYTFGGVLGGAGANENNLALVKNGAGTLTLSAANTYAGGTTIGTGTLIAGNASALGTGSVIVSGGALQTTVVNLNTGALTVNNATSVVSINGTGVGTVTLATGANLALSAGLIAIDITDASSLDKFVGTGGTGTFSLTGGTLALNGFAGFESVGSYALITGFSGTGNTVSNLNITGYDTTNWLASVDANTGMLVFTAVPEPATYGLLGAGALAAAAMVRRRKRE